MARLKHGVAEAFKETSNQRTECESFRPHDLERVIIIIVVVVVTEASFVRQERRDPTRALGALFSLCAWKHGRKDGLTENEKLFWPELLLLLLLPLCPRKQQQRQQQRPLNLALAIRLREGERKRGKKPEKERERERESAAQSLWHHTNDGGSSEGNFRVLSLSVCSWGLEENVRVH